MQVIILDTNDAQIAAILIALAIRQIRPTIVLSTERPHIPKPTRPVVPVAFEPIILVMELPNESAVASVMVSSIVRPIARPIARPVARPIEAVVRHVKSLPPVDGPPKPPKKKT